MIPVHSRPNPRRKLLLQIWFVLFVLLTAIFAAADHGWSALYVEHRGVVLERGSYQTAVTWRRFERLGVSYSYEWEGRRYESSEISSSFPRDDILGGWKYRRATHEWPSTAKEFVARHPVGGPVTVFVNRLSPSRSALAVDGLIPDPWLPGVVPIAGFLVIPTVAFLRRRARSARLRAHA